MAKMSSRQAAEKIMAYAVKNYERGYDFIVECYSIDDIVREMDENGYGYRDMMADFRIVRDVREDRIADARNSAF